MNENTGNNSQYNFKGPVDARGAQFGCQYIYTSKPIDIIFNDACNEVEATIDREYSSNIQIQGELLSKLGQIRTHFDRHKTILDSLNNTIACRRPYLLESVKHMLFVGFINFCITGLYYESSLELPETIDTGLKIMGKMKWACSASNSRPVSIETHCAAIKRMFQQHPVLKKGIFYLFNVHANNCAECLNTHEESQKYLETIMNRIFGDFVTGNIKQYSLIEFENTIGFSIKCGECLSDISRIENSKGKL